MVVAASQLAFAAILAASEPGQKIIRFFTSNVMSMIYLLTTKSFGQAFFD